VLADLANRSPGQARHCQFTSVQTVSGLLVESERGHEPRDISRCVFFLRGRRRELIEPSPYQENSPVKKEVATLHRPLGAELAQRFLLIASYHV
jgi:hypothetical protein